MMHNLKIWPEYFEAVSKGYKPFELRKNDREFKVGDGVTLEEFDPKLNTFTGRSTIRKITYILEHPDLPPLYCILGFGPRGGALNTSLGM